MIQDEYEYSFILKLDDAEKLVQDDGWNSKRIIDFYLDQDNRVRMNNNSFVATSKSGDKSTGHRKESTTIITPSSIQDYEQFLQSTSKLVIDKVRHSKVVGEYTITVDLVSSPMKIGVVEIETESKDAFEKLKSELANINTESDEDGLIDCPLNAWKFFKRKIGFAGGDSSGKTTMAKHIAMILNIEYDANASDIVEYATSFIQKNGRPPSFEDQAWIQIKQEDREHAVASTANIVLSDSPPPLSYLYAQRAIRYGKHTPHSDFALESLYKRNIKALREYDMIFVMSTLKYKNNGVRYNNKSLSSDMRGSVLRFLENHGRSHMTYCTDYTRKEEILNCILYMNDLEDVQALLSNITQEESNVTI